MSTAFLFPGQGSQSIGMQAELYRESSQVKRTFAEASEVLGFDLWALCIQGPVEKLNQTEHTQPAMLAADIATWRVWKEAGGNDPAHMAGHSLGEYAALVAAGSLQFSSAVELVSLRGRLMQAASPEGLGAMAAVIGLDDDILEGLCARFAGEQSVSCANYNAPGQVVIAGHRAAVERVCEAAKEAGARRALLLPVSVPSHCALMKDAADELFEALEAITIEPPAVPVWHNADVRNHSEADDIRAVLARQLWQPVRWTSTIMSLKERGVDHFLECGPGKVLAGLNRRILKEARVSSLLNVASMEELLE